MGPSAGKQEILDHCVRIAAGQAGGTLATLHAEDGTPYPTFVLFHLLSDGRVVFGSERDAQHSRDMDATPEVAFLIDNRDVNRTDWTRFDRIVIEGTARKVDPSDARHGEYLEALKAKNRLAAYFAQQGHLYCIEPRRMTLRRALDPVRYTVEFDGAD